MKQQSVSRRPGPVNLEADRGQVVPLMVLAIMVLGALLVLAVRHNELLNDRARAQTAADAAALAGAAEGPDRARQLAAANGAEMLSWRAEGEGVEVVVRVGNAQATARAVGVVQWVVP